MHGDDASADAQTERSRRDVLTATGTVGAALLAGCFGGSESGGDSDPEDADEPSSDSATSTESMGAESASRASWKSFELSAVRADETFTVQALDAPVVVQSFAVWCPKCQRQSEKLTNLNDSITLLGLNVDHNEDVEKVRRHANDNDFDWQFAVAPQEMTQSLVDQFGPTVTNAPSTPKIVVCEDGTTEFLSGSIHSADEIEGVVEDC